MPLHLSEQRLSEADRLTDSVMHVRAPRAAVPRSWIKLQTGIIYPGLRQKSPGSRRCGWDEAGVIKLSCGIPFVQHDANCVRLIISHGVNEQDAFICITSDGSFLRPLKAPVLIDSVSEIIQGQQLIFLRWTDWARMVAAVRIWLISAAQESNRLISLLKTITDSQNTRIKRKSGQFHARDWFFLFKKMRFLVLLFSFVIGCWFAFSPWGRGDRLWYPEGQRRTLLTEALAVSSHFQVTEF